MATPPAETLILRFRDLSTPPGGTIKQHEDIANKEGFVWWGWWHKPGETVPEQVFRALRGQAIKSTAGLRLFLMDSGTNSLYEVSCSDIAWDISLARIPSPDSAKTPLYYRDQEYFAWFRFNKINNIPLSKEEITKWTYVRVDEFFTEQPSRHEAFYNKIIYSLDELHQQNRTIWFVRTAQPSDLTHYVSLLDPRTLQPNHFPTGFETTRRRSLLWLSDVHFSKDGHHRFPTDHSHPSRHPLLKQLEKSLKESSKAFEDVGGVLLSGDITWEADEIEFKAADQFLRELIHDLSLDIYNFAVCPGNHDIAFSKTPSIKGAVVNIAPEVARHNYEKFYQGLFYIKPNEYLSSGRRFLLGGAVPVEVICLNSSLLTQTKNTFQGQGFIGDQQLRHAAEKMGWHKDHQGVRALRVVMLHHHLVPVTYREAPEAGRKYSVVLDAEALMRWCTDHRVRLVLHGHMHQPFCVKVSRPVNVTEPDKDWHVICVAGMGSSGVNQSHLGEEGQNTYAVLRAEPDRIMLEVYTIHPTEPSKRLWTWAIPFKEELS